MSFQLRLAKKLTESLLNKILIICCNTFLLSISCLSFFPVNHLLHEKKIIIVYHSKKFMIIFWEHMLQNFCLTQFFESLHFLTNNRSINSQIINTKWFFFKIHYTQKTINWLHVLYQSSKNIHSSKEKSPSNKFLFTVHTIRIYIGSLSRSTNYGVQLIIPVETPFSSSSLASFLKLLDM